MAKNTFENLKTEKRNRVIKVIKDKFSSLPFREVKVTDIVKELGIARGSFYQYFDDIYDAYFTILDMYTTEIHELFIKIMKENNFNIIKSLEIYKDRVADEIYDEVRYGLYKNQYLHWDNKLVEKYEKFKEKQYKKIPATVSLREKEKMMFVKSIIHSLILRLFLEEWDKQTFKEKFSQNIKWLEKGIL